MKKIKYFKIIIVLGLGLITSNAFGSFSISAPASVAATPGEIVQIPIQVTSTDAESITRFYITGGGSEQAASCVKAYAANETCTFNFSIELTVKRSIRITAYPESSSRPRATVLLDVQDYLEDLTGALEIKVDQQIIAGALDLGSVDIQEDIVRRVYVRNIQNKTTRPLNSVSLIGSGMYSVIADTCAGKNLKFRHICYFDILVDAGKYQAGGQSVSVNLGTASNPTSGLPNLSISGTFTQTLTELPANVSVASFHTASLNYNSGIPRLSFGTSNVKHFLPRHRVETVQRRFQYDDGSLPNYDGLAAKGYIVYTKESLRIDQTDLTTQLIAIPGTRWRMDRNLSNQAEINNLGVEIEDKASSLSVYEYLRKDIDECLNLDGVVTYRQNSGADDLAISTAQVTSLRELKCAINGSPNSVRSMRISPADYDLTTYLDVESLMSAYNIPPVTYQGESSLVSYMDKEVADLQAAATENALLATSVPTNLTSISQEFINITNVVAQNRVSVTNSVTRYFVPNSIVNSYTTNSNYVSYPRPSGNSTSSYGQGYTVSVTPATTAAALVSAVSAEPDTSWRAIGNSFMIANSASDGIRYITEIKSDLDLYRNHKKLFDDCTSNDGIVRIGRNLSHPSFIAGQTENLRASTSNGVTAYCFANPSDLGVTIELGGVVRLFAESVDTNVYVDHDSVTNYYGIPSGNYNSSNSMDDYVTNKLLEIDNL